MHQRREPPDRQVSNTENAEIHEEGVTNLYLTHRDLAEYTLDAWFDRLRLLIEHLVLNHYITLNLVSRISGGIRLHRNMHKH